METPEITPSGGVFVVGSPRSGTSVLAWALAEHADFWTSAESDVLTYLFGKGHLHDSYRRAYDRPDRGWLTKNQVAFPEFCSYVGLGVDRLFSSRSGGRRWIDATPSYTLMAPELALMFPKACFVHIVRDGRSVISSMIQSGFDTEWASDFKLACQTWSHFALEGHRFAEANRDRAIELRHELLVEDPEAELGRVFEFLDVDYAPSSAKLISTKRINSSYGNRSPGDVRAAKDPKTAPKQPWNSWTHSQRQIFEELAGASMQELGYSLT